jgi:phosphoserine phosphatase RsbU/P
MRILVAEDERITRMSLTRQLQQWEHSVCAVEDGQQAWEQFGAERFDMLITDWEMPRLTGVDLIRQVRGRKGDDYSYIILLTSRSDKSDVVQGIEAGADDFVCKPFDLEELRVRLLAGQRIITLEQALKKQNAELRYANERIHYGLSAAARVQRSMLPTTNVINDHIATAWRYVPTEELAGDAIGLHFVDNRYLVTYVLDVSGHGVPAALLSVSAMHALSPVPEHSSLLRKMTGTDQDLGTVQHPSIVATELNHRFRAADNDGRYLTMILTVLDAFTGKLYLSRAGHPPPLLLRGEKAIELEEGGGFPIAVVDDEIYEEASMQLQPGDRLCFFSDGILEQPTIAGEGEFGLERLRESLAATRAQSAKEAADGVVHMLSTFAGWTNFRDDVSLAIVDWKG